MKNHRTKLLCAALLLWLCGCTSLSSQVFADAYALSKEKISIEVDHKSQIVLRDKSGHFYEIYFSPYLKNGVAEFSYYIEALGTEQATLLGGGEGDGVDGGCGVGSRKEMLNLEKGVLGISLEIKKINRDGWLDILVEYTQEDCKTGEKQKVTNIFYATENGFQQLKEGSE